ncbi:MAG: acyl-CoA dehydrogenase [Hamadaea sp.]|nr:acyl-CoA dehydrogenase [Hamadaea sp.]
MDFALTSEQQELRDVARRALSDRFPPAAVAAAAATGTLPDAWRLVEELGWFDTGFVDRAVLAEECGYVLLPTPWWSALALAEAPAGPVAPAWGAVTVQAGADGLRLTGTAADVPDAPAASSILFCDGTRTFEVAAADCRLTPVDGVDPLRAAADVTCTGARATERAAVPVPRVETLLAAEAVGVARRAYDIAVDHAKTREQFGRPIGAYQGISFPLADCLVLIETARSLAYRAAWLVAHGTRDEADLAVAMALPAAREAAVTACEQAIQTLGGLGMTWEHPLHHWYRRALWLQGYGVADEEYFDQVAAALL